jgi:hypothetical protein
MSSLRCSPTSPPNPSVSDPDAPPLDATVILGAFVESGAQFVVVGGVATVVQGARRATRDIDLRRAWDDANLARIVIALRRLGAQMKTDQTRGMGTQPSVRMLPQDGDHDVADPVKAGTPDSHVHAAACKPKQKPALAAGLSFGGSQPRA